jgi:hypothetical protein
LKKWLKITIIVVTGLLVGVLTFSLNKSYITANTSFDTVVVAAENISPYGLISNYRTKKVVRSAVPDDAVKDTTILKNKEWYAGKLGIGEGDIIRKSRIVDTATNPFGQVLAVKKDHVLIGVKTDQIFSAGKNIKPGVRAHAFVFIPGDQRTTSDRVIGPQNDPLLANLLVKEVQNAEATSLAEKGREALPVVAVLETTIPVAQKIVLYQETGKIYLAPAGIDVASAITTLSQNTPIPQNNNTAPQTERTR